MDTQKLIDILSQIKAQLKSHSLLTSQSRINLLKKVENAEEIYAALEISNPLEDLYASLIKAGNDLLVEIKRNRSSKELAQKITSYLSYLHASTYDFKDSLDGVKYYTR